MNKEEPPVLDTSYASRDDIVRDIDQLLQAQRDDTWQKAQAYYEPLIKVLKGEPFELSDDWENNLYRNIVHTLAETERMIPGGQAERVMKVCDVLYGDKIQQAWQETDAISYTKGVLDGGKKAVREIFEEIKPHLEKIDKLTSDIEGDWTDPRYECDKISEEIQAILRILEEK